MGIFSAMDVGVTGLYAQSRQLENASQNIANINTVGYKEENVRFNELVIAQEGTVGGASYSGASGFSHVYNSKQGTLRRTQSPTDIAIVGPGLMPISRTPTTTTEILYTRAGSFEPDKDGYFVNKAGFYLQAWPLDAEEKLATDLTGTTVDGATGLAALRPVVISQDADIPVPTTNVDPVLTLNAGQSAYGGPPAYVAGDMASGTISPHFLRNVTVYDSLGESHDLTLGFLKSGVNTWEVEIYSQNPTELTSGNPIATGTLTFNGDGTLATVGAGLSAAAAITWQNGAAASAITFNWGTAGPPFGTVGATVVGRSDGVSQYDTAYNVVSMHQNGFSGGNLSSISITADGYIAGNYNDGSTHRLYKLPLANFINPDQLTSLTGNAFSASVDNSDVSFLQAGVDGSGVIHSASLEESNAELETQLVQMIIAQRAYQANSKTILTSEQMLQRLDEMVG